MRKGFFARLALTSIRKNRKVYYPYMLTAIVTVAMLYIIASLSRNSGLHSQTLAFTLSLGLVTTTAFSVIFLFYTNSFLIKRRKREFGLYNILGMEKKHIGRVVLWETLIVLFVSLTAGFAVGMLLDKLMFMILLHFLGESTSISYQLSLSAVLYTAAVIGVTFLLMLLNSLRRIHFSKPIELLHGDQVGEAEPKTKWVLTVLGVLTLGFGYWISVAVTNAVASIVLFFVAVMLVIAGTYMLFTAGSITALKLLRKNKRYYYKSNHFINVSGMIYRMRQNAVGLGNVCILSTMVLVMVFATVSLWCGMKDMLRVTAPYDVDVETVAYEREDEVRAFTDECVAQAGLIKKDELCYSYLSFAGYRKGDTFLTDPTLDVNMFADNLTNLFIMRLDTYNNVMNAQETLNDGEILLISQRGDYHENTLHVFDRSFTVKKNLNVVLPKGINSVYIYPTQFVIVRDDQTLRELGARQNEAYGKNASAIRLYLGFELSGTDAEKDAFARAYQAEFSQRFTWRTFSNRVEMRVEMMQMYGGLLFVGLFLGSLFIMAMILIIYYKQISEGYDDRERYQIMQKVGLSRAEIKRSIGSQILTVFFLPLVTAGVHIAFAFPSLTRMFTALSMNNVSLMAVCALATFAVFSVLYGVVYTMTAKVYYKIVSQ